MPPVHSSAGNKGQRFVLPPALSSPPLHPLVRLTAKSGNRVGVRETYT